MSITDELRNEARGFGEYIYMKAQTLRLIEIADRIDEEHERETREQYTKGHNDGFDAGYASADDWYVDHAEELADHGWVKLPKDGNGEYVHVGDVMAYADNTKPMQVVALVPPSVFMVEDGPRFADMCRHYHAPTVEDVLFEFAQFWSDEELTDIEHLQTDAAQTIADFAAKLRLAGEGE